MIAWVKRHKVITALIITFVGVPIFVSILNALGVSIDIGGVGELMGLGWAIYGFAWLIWEYPKWSAKRKRRKESTDE